MAARMRAWILFRSWSDDVNLPTVSARGVDEFPGEAGNLGFAGEAGGLCSRDRAVDLDIAKSRCRKARVPDLAAASLQSVGKPDRAARAGLRDHSLGGQQLACGQLDRRAGGSLHGYLGQPEKFLAQVVDEDSRLWAGWFGSRGIPASLSQAVRTGAISEGAVPLATVAGFHEVAAKPALSQPAVLAERRSLRRRRCWVKVIGPARRGP